MVFTSPVFIFYFLPLFFLTYCLAMLARRAFRDSDGGGAFRTGNLVILLFSVLFYFWGENNGTIILLGIIALNYFLAFLLAPTGPADGATRKRWLIVCVAANLLCLFVFKYAGFACRILVELTGLNMPVPDISLPLGISFFIFQAMSYVIDVYRGAVGVNRSFVGFACFISMFPQLVAGPIVRYIDIAEQLNKRAVSVELFAQGVERFIFGLAKKVLIANNVALFADVAFALQPDRLTPAIAWTSTVCYAIQIYFDFSGYSDMAIGLGKMLGFTFRENFLHPYSAVSMQDFWRRWHISLSTWFRDYLYIPLVRHNPGIASFPETGQWSGFDITADGESVAATEIQNELRECLYRNAGDAPPALKAWFTGDSFFAKFHPLPETFLFKSVLFRRDFRNAADFYREYVEKRGLEKPDLVIEELVERGLPAL